MKILGAYSQNNMFSKWVSNFGWKSVEKICSYSYRVPYCVPSWNRATYRAMIRCFLRKEVIVGLDVDRLMERLKQFFSVPAVIPCRSGRVAIELALRASGVSEGDEVAVPTFCCTSVIPPILSVGAIPILTDVGEELSLTPEMLGPALSSKTKAVIVPHLFGNPSQIKEIVGMCHDRGIIVIDDAAQAFGATLDGRPLGTFGDAGVVSFGNGKVCFGTGGGVLVSRRTDILERARQVKLSRGTFSRGALDGLSILIWRRWRQWSLPLQAVISRVKRPKIGSQPYLKETMRNMDAAIALTLLDTLENNIHARRERVSAYQRFFEGNPRLALIQHGVGSACLTQVIQINRATDIIKALRGRGYEVNGSYTPLHLFPEYRKFARWPLKNAERKWNNLIELPCEPSVSLDEVANISSIVREYLR
jgi:dTDP-4-amino-4,6-dideoxygalactose transaminase